MLRGAVLAGAGLVLLTPFVVTWSTVFPYVVGKALYSRALIEIVVALWAALALVEPRYRPPRSWVLVALGAGLAVALAAAAAGVDWQRSLWSNWERMQGLVDRAHWCAFALVLASVLRTGTQWRLLLGVGTAVAAALAALAAAQALGWEAPHYGAGVRAGGGRPSGPLGNPTFLGGYAMANAVLALGLAARALGAERDVPWPARAAAAAPWAAAAALLLAAVGLSSRGAVLGLAAAGGALAVGYALLGRGRARLAAVGVLAALVLAAGAAGTRAADAERRASTADSRVGGLLAGAHLAEPSVRSRLAAWRAGLAGFAERPLLGWGPENFGTVFGRFGQGYAATSEAHDHAHGQLVEVAATTGAAGLAAYLALWSAAFAALWRAARSTAGAERAWVLFAAAALAATLVQTQTLFDTAAGSLQAALLFAFAARLEDGAGAPRRAPRLPVRLAAAWSGALRRTGVRALLGAAAAALALAGLGTHRAVLAAADVRAVTSGPWAWRPAAAGIAAFAPLANGHRRHRMERLAVDWPRLRRADRTRALRLYAWTAREAAAALAAAPTDWRVAHAAARMHAVVASTEPKHAGAARAARDRARALAPRRALFPKPLAAPGPLDVRPLAGGGHELVWRPVAGSGYHVVRARAPSGRWRSVLHAWAPGRDSLTVRAAPGTRPPAYRVRACRRPGDCGPWAFWPARDAGARGRDR